MIELDCRKCVNADMENDRCKIYGADPDKAVENCSKNGFNNYKETSEMCWISVEDKPIPDEKYGRYLCRAVNFRGVVLYDVCEFSYDEWKITYDVDLTHWMPIAPPTGEKE